MKLALPLILSLVLPACASVGGIPLSTATPVQEYGSDYGSSSDLYGKEREYSREGTYIGVGFAYGIDDFDLNGGASADNSPGFDFRFGFRMSEQFSLEIDSTYMTGYKVSVRTPFGTASDDLTTWATVVQGKFYLSQGKLQPFVLAGFGLESAEVDGTSDDGTVMRVGGGLDYYLSPKTALYFEATFNSVNMSDFVDLDAAVLQAGLIFRF